MTEFGFSVYTIAGAPILVLTYANSLPFKAGIIAGVGADLGEFIPLLCWCKAGVMFPGKQGVRQVPVPSSYSGIRAVSGSPMPQQIEHMAIASNAACACVPLVITLPRAAFRSDLVMPKTLRESLQLHQQQFGCASAPGFWIAASLAYAHAKRVVALPRYACI